MTNLREFKCIPCQGTELPLSGEEWQQYKPEIPDWDIVEENGIPQLRRTYKFKDFVEAINFANQVATIAEEEDHHPRLIIDWGRVTVQWWTHKIRGLHRNDFIMAAKTDAIKQDESKS